MSGYDPVEIDDVTVERETAAAILCLIDGEGVWIPKSQIHDDSEVWKSGTEGKLVIPIWLAEEKELV
jgi:hypothetical protein